MEPIRYILEDALGSLRRSRWGALASIGTIAVSFVIVGIFLIITGNLGALVADWKEPFREGVVYYLTGGRVRGVLLWNTWGQVDAARALIAEPGPFEDRDLVGRIGS